MRKHLQLAALTLLCAAGCKSTPPPTPTTTTLKPGLMSAASRVVFTQSAAQHPAFKVFLQKQDVPTILVVDEAATDARLNDLLWYLRIQTRDSKLKDLGIKPTAIVFGTPGYTSGNIAIYRGPRCASEMYGAANPCGPSIHKAATYHWGDAGDPRGDGASLNDNIVFTADDGFQTDTEAHNDPDGALHRASLARIRFATAQNANSSKQHADVRFAVGDPDDQLRIVSYQLTTDVGRASFLRQYLILEQDHLCPLGFKALQLGALGSAARPYPLACTITQATFSIH